VGTLEKVWDFLACFSVIIWQKCSGLLFWTTLYICLLTYLCVDSDGATDVWKIEDFSLHPVYISLCCKHW